MTEERKYYVYQLRREDQELPFYVGKGCGRRAYKHLHPSSIKSSSTLKNNIISKALSEGVGIIVEFLEEGLTSEEALEFEKFFISAYGRRDLNEGFLSNHTDGGEEGYRQSRTEETRKKIAEASKGRKHTLYSKQKISKANCGRVRSDVQGVNNPNAKLTEKDVIEIYELLGNLTQIEIAEKFNVSLTTLKQIKHGSTWSHLHHLYDSNKKRASGKRKGLRMSEQSIKKMAETKRGRVLSKSHRESISLALKKYHQTKLLSEENKQEV